MDAVHFPLDDIHTSYELGARGRKGNVDLRGEGILPPKCIYTRLFDKLEPGNNTVGIHTGENFSERRWRKGWFLTSTTVDGKFSMGHL